MRVRITENSPAQVADEGCAASVAELARTIGAYEQTGIDDLIVGPVPVSIRSLNQLAEAFQVFRHPAQDGC